MKLSVVTATYNAVNHLPRLIESLRNQEDHDFEWVVADGGSTDGTLELVNSIKDLNIIVTSKEDFGIYDALTRAIKVCSGDFYLVMGADDILYPNAIKDYKARLADSVDIVTAPIVAGSSIWSSRMKAPWLYGHVSFVSCHSVGTVFRKSLHEIYGNYSKKFPIAADQHFILKSCLGGARVIKIESIVGVYGSGGLSSVDTLGTLTEFFRVQISCGFNKYAQLLLFLLRLSRSLIQGRL